MIRPMLAVAVLAAASADLPAQERAVVLRGGTVLPVSGPAIPNGVVVMQGGKIVAVGASPRIPVGAEIVDVRGKFVMPGIIDAMSNIGIAASDQDEATEPLNPANRALEAYNPYGDFGSGAAGP
ncbi:MAG: amidohydrolase, partial [Gemmatimonadales bacterium]